MNDSLQFRSRLSRTLGMAVLLMCGCVDPIDRNAAPKAPRNASSSPQPIGLPKNEWFREQVQGDVPVLVDLSATWCGPCQMMKPTLEKVCVTYGDRLKFVEVDVDQHPDVAMHFLASSIPTVLVLKNGKTVGKVSGVKSFEQLVDLLTPVIGEPTPSGEKR